MVHPCPPRPSLTDETPTPKSTDPRRGSQQGSGFAFSAHSCAVLNDRLREISALVFMCKIWMQFFSSSRDFYHNSFFLSSPLPSPPLLSPPLPFGETKHSLSPESVASQRKPHVHANSRGRNFGLAIRTGSSTLLGSRQRFPWASPASSPSPPLP